MNPDITAIWWPPPLWILSVPLGQLQSILWDCWKADVDSFYLIADVDFLINSLISICSLTAKYNLAGHKPVLPENLLKES